MSSASDRQKVVIIGAGPVGALAAYYAAERGDNVELYELRGDPRDASTTPLNWTKSINLALSERGINAMSHASKQLIEAVMKESIPMAGRMIHGRTPTGALFEAAQPYDVLGRHINAIDRWQLNKTLLDFLDSRPNVKLHFQHKLTGADYRAKRAWIEDHSGEVTVDGNKTRYPEIEISFDLLIGADGAHSAARFHLMKFARMSYEQIYIDTLWCEFSLAPRQSPASSETSFAISSNHLHIWPGRTHMFIAIPSTDKSFTCTLFAPESVFLQLRNSPNRAAAVPAYFREHFPGVTPELIPEDELVRQFDASPALPLISIKCTPYHFQDAGVIVGDAAHAMVPFYGQGMNAGLEDVRVLFECLEAAGVYDARSENARKSCRTRALANYTEMRTPDAAAINDLALGNYYEMRAGVVNPLYRLRKAVEETITRVFPSSGFATQYVRVSFTNQRYSEVELSVLRQIRLEAIGGIGLLAAAIGVCAATYYRFKR